MFHSLRGILILKTLDTAVIDCGGVGYACKTTLSTLSSLPKTGTEVTLLTYLKVSADNIELFGFATNEELNCFKMIISVSGVGPKAGLAILSDTTPEKFAMTVALGDYKAFTKTKGIGTKIAQRIVLELKDKISKELGQVSSVADMDFAVSVKGGALSEAMAALTVLGYSQSEAANALSGLDTSLSAEELIRLSLKKMAVK